MKTTRTLIRALFPALLASAALQAQEHPSHRHEHPAAHGGAVPLLPGLGDWHHPITAASPEARRYFDQGLRLAYAFNHDEAERSFEQAARLDPSCAMCRWGIAYALSPNINQPMDSAAEAKALAAIREARRLLARATPRERAYVEALEKRFGEPAGAERAARDSAYAAAMRDLAARHPGDADAQVLYADALLNLRPWNQWTRDGRPQPGTPEAVAALERAMALAPTHAGACHFYIHAVEASPAPERALPCAEKLPRLMPGAGHLVHMPAHVYLRVGMYEEAARANIAAVEADHRYFQGRDVPAGVYPMFYHPHNLHFLWAAYLASGQREKALGAAGALLERVSAEEAAGIPSLQAFLTPRILTFARFGDWDAVLAEPAPAEGLRYARGIHHYARGVALAGKGETERAGAELASLRAVARELPADMVVILNPAPAVLAIAERVLEATILAARGEHDAAVALLRDAAAREDALTYDEPPPWYHPVRQVLGRVLLDAGRPAEAVAAFEEDLRWVPRNGWSLHGLETALRRLGRDAEADSVAKRFAEAWRHADVDAGAGFVAGADAS